MTVSHKLQKVNGAARAKTQYIKARVKHGLSTGYKPHAKLLLRVSHFVFFLGIVSNAGIVSKHENPV
jgi:hypothetical protein